MNVSGRLKVDVLVEYGGGGVFGFASPGAHHARHLSWLKSDLGKHFLRAALLHTVRRAFELADGIVAAPISELWA